jgi:thiamine-monophosphate kinase
MPSLHLKLSNKLLTFANTSIDISDGLIADLEKLINKQKLSYEINLKNIPISKNLKKLLIQKKLDKTSYVSRGDDYQILFTANSSKSRIINKTAKSLGIKISNIGKIRSYSHKSQIIDQKGNKITLKNKGYYHNF